MIFKKSEWWLLRGRRDGVIIREEHIRGRLPWGSQGATVE